MRYFPIIFLFFCYFSAISTKPSKPREGNADREFKRKMETCEKKNCEHIPQFFNENCINKCISANCFDRVFGQDLLEPGEIDTRR